MYCPNCGCQITNSTQNFCYNCGFRLSILHPTSNYTSSYAPTYAPTQAYQIYSKKIGPAGPFSKRSLSFGLVSISILVLAMIISINHIIHFYRSYLYIYGSVAVIFLFIFGLMFGIFAKKFSSDAIQEPYNMAQNLGRIMGIYGIILNSIFLCFSFYF